MHHTAAFFEVTDNVVNNPISALSDGILSIQNNNFMLPQDMWLLYFYAASATLQRARLTSPSLRQITSPQIRPVNVAILPGNDPKVMHLDRAQVRIRGLEELQYQITSGVAMTENAYGVIGLLDRYSPIPSGDPVILRGTGATTVVASVWSPVTYTLDDQLPNGTYAITGGEVQSTSCIAYRWTIDGMFYRPGGIGINALSNRTVLQQYDGTWGEWGRFKNTSLPRLEVLCNAADTAQVIFLQVVKVA